MQRVVVAKEWVGTQRPLGLTVVAVAVQVLLSAAAGQASHYNICSTHRNSIKLHAYDTAFIGTNAFSTNVRVEAAGCVKDSRMLYFGELTASNETSWKEKNLLWYELTYISCGAFTVKIGGKIVHLKWKAIQPLPCFDRPITLSVEPDVRLGQRCIEPPRDREVKQSQAACKALRENVPDTNKPLLNELLDLLNSDDISDASNGMHSDQEDPTAPAGDSSDINNIFNSQDLYPNGPDAEDNTKTFKNWQKINYDDIAKVTPAYSLNEDTYFGSNKGYNTRRNYKENAIPIFIGIVAFTVSMCLRFCLCRGKSVVRRVTTVTVIRSHPAGSDAPLDQQDPPPSYVDVVNETTSPQSPVDEANAEPPPPAYADIVDEAQPPTYSEVEAQSMPASEEAPLADQEAEAPSRQPPPDPESASDVKGSPSSKNVLSKYRSQQKQFAFKVLEEDD